MTQEFKALVLNTIQKELRSKTLYIVFGFTILLIVLVNVFVDFIYSNVLDENATQMIGDKTAMVVYLAIDFWSSFLCILFGVNTIRSDMSSGTLGQMLSFPIKRRTFVLARLVGSCAIVFFYYICSLVIAVSLFSLTSNKVIGGVEMAYALVPSFLGIFIIMILAINFSLFLPRMMAFIGVSFLTLLISLSNKVFMEKTFQEQFQDLGVIKSIGLMFHTLFPRLGVVTEGVGYILFDGKIEFNVLYESIHLIVVLSLWAIVTLKLFEKEDY